MPTLRQLNALSLIAQTGSFTLAAGRLFITQSAVSALIRELEEELGQKLIVRGRSLRLTAAGEHLQRAGSRAQRELDHALQDLKGSDASQWTQEVIRIAAGSLSAATFVPRALAQLARTHAGVRAVLIDRPVAMVGDLVLSNEADVAIGAIDAGTRLSSELQAELLLSDALCVVAARASELGGRLSRHQGKVRWAMLEGSCVILAGLPGGLWNISLQDQIAMHNMRVAYEVQLISTAVEMVRQNLGLAIFPRLAAHSLDPKTFSVGALHSTTRWTTHWITRKASAPESPGMAALRRALKAAV